MFIVRLLSACLQYHWSWYKKHIGRISREANITEEAVAAAAAVGAYTDDTSTPPKEEEEIALDPPPLDEALVSFLLNLMGRFLNQLHVIEERNDQLLAFEQTNEIAVANRIDTQLMEYIREVYNTSGKVLCYISASNWNSFYAKIKNTVNILAATNENSESNPPEIRILSFTNLNTSKLRTILTGKKK